MARSVLLVDDEYLIRYTLSLILSQHGYAVMSAANGCRRRSASRPSTKLLPDRDGGRLALMDEHGIDMQILSYSNPSQNAPADQQVQLTRQANDMLAEAARANPSRFGGFACLPWGHPEAAAQELERAVKELSFVGTRCCSAAQETPSWTILATILFWPNLMNFACPSTCIRVFR